MNNQQIIKKLHKLLLKKAQGFFYKEECLEYCLNEKENKKSNKNQISMFDNFTNNENSLDSSSNLIFECAENENFEQNEKTCKKSVTKMKQIKNCDVECGQKQINKIINKENVNVVTTLANNNEDKQSLTLSKKKITTHFVPPDMLAIKMLLEINSKELSPELFNLTDDELKKLILNLKGELGI